MDICKEVTVLALSVVRELLSLFTFYNQIYNFSGGQRSRPLVVCIDLSVPMGTIK